MVENYSFSVPSRVVADSVDGGSPEFDEFHNISSQLSEMVNVLEDDFKLILPAFSSLLATLLRLETRAAMFLCYFESPLGFSLFSQRL